MKHKIDWRDKEQKKESALDIIYNNVRKKYPHYNKNLCKKIAKNIYKSSTVALMLLVSACSDMDVTPENKFSTFKPYIVETSPQYCTPDFCADSMEEIYFLYNTQ